MLLLALVVGTMSSEDTVSSSDDTTKDVVCIPLFSTYTSPVVYPSTKEMFHFQAVECKC